MSLRKFLERNQQNWQEKFQEKLQYKKIVAFVDSSLLYLDSWKNLILSLKQTRLFFCIDVLFWNLLKIITTMNLITSKVLWRTSRSLITTKNWLKHWLEKKCQKSNLSTMMIVLVFAAIYYRYFHKRKSSKIERSKISWWQQHQIILEFLCKLSRFLAVIKTRNQSVLFFIKTVLSRSRKRI